jgi:hypothetical protein
MDDAILKLLDLSVRSLWQLVSNWQAKTAALCMDVAVGLQYETMNLMSTGDSTPIDVSRPEMLDTAMGAVHLLAYRFPHQPSVATKPSPTFANSSIDTERPMAIIILHVAANARIGLI